jgi:membrane protein DedA with SNARE-associated domain
MTAEALGWYGSIFAALFFTGIGLPPAPEEVGILYAASLRALHPEAVGWVGAWLACALGILAADCVLYGAGRRWGPKLFEYRWVQKVMSAERRARIERRFEQHGMKILVLARFLPPLRLGVFLISGASKYPFWKFVVADAIYLVFGVGAFLFAGTWLIELIKWASHWAAYAGGALLIVYGLYRYYRYLKRCELGGDAGCTKKDEAAPAPPVSILQGPEGSVPEGQPAKDPAKAPAAKKEAKIVLGEE